MEDLLIGLLSGFGYPVYRQGSMSDDSVYPETFLTFWNFDSPDHAHYDNAEYGAEWNYNVYVYSADPELTYSVMAETRRVLREAGWICVGKGFDVASDEHTHTGRGLNVIYLET